MDGSTPKSVAACIIANQQLQKHLAKFGYAPTARTPGLWIHSSCNIAFSLVVDNFGVKYVGRDNAHIYSAPSKNCTQSPPTGPANSTVASPSTGTTTIDTSTFPCLDMLKPPSTSSSTQLQPALKTALMRGISQPTVLKSNTPKPLTPALASRPKKRLAFSRSLALFYIME